MTPREGVKALLQLEAQIDSATDDAVDALLAETLQIAHIKSSGTFDEFARWDHPLAKRHGAPLIDPGIINKHKGYFDAGWHRIGNAIVNDSAVADFLQYGTKFMFQRPVKEEIEAGVELHAKSIAEIAMKRVIRS